MRLTAAGCFFVLAIASNAGAGDSKTDCPMHPHQSAEQKGPDSSKAVDHHAGVDERGDVAMGFSHQKAVHHFGLTRDGGFISAEASEAADLASRDAIRRHFQHIVTAFSSGDFDLPMFIHQTSVPGVATMKKLKAVIRYRLEELDSGGRIVVSTKDPDALRAVHRFLKFQIEDHRTGDSVSTSMVD